jgi:hypothetical protein
VFSLSGQPFLLVRSARDAAAQLHDLIRWRTRGYDEMSGEMSGVVSYHRASKVGWSNIRKKSDKIFY